jgi:hypothetical protein
MSVRATDERVKVCDELNALADFFRESVPTNPWDVYFPCITNILLPKIEKSERCQSLASVWEVDPKIVATAIHAACGISDGVDILTYYKKTMNDEYVHLVINDVALTSHAISVEYERITAAAAPAMGGAGGPAAADRLAEVEAACPADSDSSSDRCPFPSSFGDPIVEKLGREVRRLGYAVEFRERELAAAAAQIADLEQKYEEAQRAAAEAAQAAAAARLAEVEAAAQTRAAADAERIADLESQLAAAALRADVAENNKKVAIEAITGLGQRTAAAEAAKDAAIVCLAEEKAARAQDATAAAERISLLEQQLSNAMQMAQNIFWAACEAVRGMAY